MSEVRLCARCPKVGRDGVDGRPEPNPKYEKHSSYCKVCVREYNADRYRQATSTKEFLPDLERKVVGLLDQVVRIKEAYLSHTFDDMGDHIDLMHMNVSGLLRYVYEIENKLPGKIKEKRDAHEQRTSKKSEVKNTREYSDFEGVFKIWYKLIDSGKNGTAGDIYDRYIAPRPHWVQWFDEAHTKLRQAPPSS